MADAIVSFGVQKLWEFLSRESARLNGLDEQVDGLKRQLERLQSLLEDADTKKHESKRVRNFLEDVKDIVYDVEDIIEIFLLKEVRGNEKGIKKRVKKFACSLVNRRKLALDIEGITKRISEVIVGMQSFGIQQIIDGSLSLSLQERQREIRLTFPYSSDNDLVGMEQSVEELVGHLVDNDNIQVVSVSGMGGIGKSTLARQVFNHDIVRRHFDGFAWVCISQEFTQKHVWQRILKDLRPHEVGILQMDEYTLQAKLFELLETGRYMVVLDDIWKEEDWDRIKAVFPRRKGWKMLLTSRNENVGLHVDPTCFAFRPRILTLEESWKLCQRIAFPRGDDIEFRVDKEMEAMGKKMVTYCGRLPLAVTVLGGLLAKKHTVTEWKRVHDNIGPQIVRGSGLDDNNLNSVYRVLSMSYEDLPMQLKHCFLYLAHFPEDYKIRVEKLFNLWEAEGIVTTIYEGATIIKSGQRYLEELVRRNLVTIENNYWTQREKYCQMHDMMREVCLSKAKEENFLEIVKVPTSSSTISAQSPHRSRRLVTHSSNALHILGHKNNQRVRSLLVFGLQEDFCIQPVPSFRSFPLLRVLDLSRAKFKGGKIPSSIGELIHLRFLNLYDAWVSHLPSSLRNLKLLLYLNLGFNGIVHVPNVLKEMQELKYLQLPMSMHDKTKLELGDLVNLESLVNFSTKYNNMTDLFSMTKLRELKVFISDESSFKIISSSLCQLGNLEALSLYDRQETCVADYHEGEIFVDCIHLKELVLAMHMPRLFNQYCYPPHLSHIYLWCCGMEDDPIPILEKLHHLKSVSLLFGAFVGRRMACSKGGFPQLCALKLSELEELEEWIVEGGSMPCIRTLILQKCRKLKELPDGIRYIASLKEMTIIEMKEWPKKLVPGGEEYHKVQNIPNVQFIKCDV